MAALLFWAFAAMFILLAQEVREGEPIWLDGAILQAVHNIASPTLNMWAVAVTTLGGAMIVAVMTSLVCGVLLIQRHWRKATVVAATVGGAVLMNLALKVLFARDRPTLWEAIVTEHSYSFPSGHAMASSALAVCLVILAWPTRWRWPVLIGAALYTLIIGLTRLYLGVHFPTDIIAGWCVSLAWMVVVVKAAKYSVRAGH